MEATKLEQKEKEEIRKSYFGGAVGKYLAKKQAEAKPLEFFLALKDFLGKLKAEEKEKMEEFKDFLPFDKNNNALPSMEELFRKSTLEKQDEIEKWIKEVDEAMDNCIRLAREQRDRIAKGEYIDSKKLLDLGLYFISNEFSFNQLLAYRERVYKAKIIEIIDKYNTSRREAQDRAEITDEYFKYNIIKRNLDTLRELEMYAKKYEKSF